MLRFGDRLFYRVSKTLCANQFLRKRVVEFRFVLIQRRTSKKKKKKKLLRFDFVRIGGTPAISLATTEHGMLLCTTGFTVTFTKMSTRLVKLPGVMLWSQQLGLTHLRHVVNMRPFEVLKKTNTECD